SLCACIRGPSEGAAPKAVAPTFCSDPSTTADWASGGLLTATLCPRPLSCTAPAGGAGPGEKRPVGGCRPPSENQSGQQVFCLFANRSTCALKKRIQICSIT